VAEAGAPLLTTQWGQGYPYNTLCPTKGNQHCPAGCVATAMAQLLRYWQWPVQGKGYSWATDGNGETYSATLEHTYAWPAMLSTTREYADQPISAQAVAQLVYDCGLSVNMNYDTDGSGAATPVKAFYENFGYVPTSMRMYNAECFSAAEWFAMICAEIDQHRPLYFRATSLTSGGRDAAGHAFVVDGYDANGNVHVNWGWDGDFDGYYALSRMNPGGYQFTINQAALFGLTPARNGETGTPTEYLFVRDPLTCNQSGTVQKTLTFNVSVSNVWNLNGSPHTWQLSLGLFDINNQMVGEVKTGRVSSLTAEPNHGYSGTFAEIGCSLKGTYPDGDYAIRLIFRDYGTTEWLLPDMAGGIAKNAVYVTLKGSRVTFTDGAAYIATAIRDLPADAATPVTDDHLTHVYDATGRLLHVVPTSRFRLSDIPAHGQLIIKQGGVVRKTIK